MFEKKSQADLRAHTKQLLAGPLKHVRAAGLAVALVPLASVAASAQTAPPIEVAPGCPSAGLCGFVWQDANGNGIQDAGELPISGAVVTLITPTGDQYITSTDSGGAYGFDVGSGTYIVEVQVPPDMEVSPPNAGTDDNIDSDGTSNSLGQSVATVAFARDGSL